MSKVNISSYSAVGGDHKAAYEAAFAAIKANGGTIFLDSQETTIKTTPSFVPDVGYVVPLVIEGDGSSRIKIDGTDSVIPIYTGNINRFHLRDMSFIPANTSELHTDCQDVVYSGYTNNAIFENLIFAGICAKNSLIHTHGATDLWVKGCQMSGTRLIETTGGSIFAEKAGRVRIEFCQFYDYQNLGNVYYSKTPSGMPAWICISNPEPTLIGNGANHPTVQISDCRFDEGSEKAILIDGYPFVSIERCCINMNGGGIGIHLKNVKHAVVKQCNAGYAATDVPIIKAENVQYLTIIGLQKDHGPNRIEVDSTTAENLKVFQSPGIVVDEV